MQTDDPKAAARKPDAEGRAAQQRSRHSAPPPRRPGALAHARAVSSLLSLPPSLPPSLCLSLARSLAVALARSLSSSSPSLLSRRSRVRALFLLACIFHPDVGAGRWTPKQMVEARQEARTGKTPATSAESDKHNHLRELYSARAREKKMHEIMLVKEVPLPLPLTIMLVKELLPPTPRRCVIPLEFLPSPSTLSELGGHSAVLRACCRRRCGSCGSCCETALHRTMKTKTRRRSPDLERGGDEGGRREGVY